MGAQEGAEGEHQGLKGQADRRNAQIHRRLGPCLCGNLHQRHKPVGPQQKQRHQHQTDGQIDHRREHVYLLNLFLLAGTQILADQNGGGQTDDREGEQ